jgi:DDE superfamily endonuclease
MTARIACPPAPGPLEEYAAQFDDLFTHAAQRRNFRDYLAGLLLPRDRNKTLTALAGAEPIVEAQEGAVQRLQFFLSESVWDAEAVNDRRLRLLMTDTVIAPHAGGVLVIDETGDRKDGTKTAHVAHQYLGSIGKIANGIVSVTSLWADERVHYPLDVTPYEPAARLPRGKTDPTFRTKPQLAVALVERAVARGIRFRAVVADSVYGENPTFESALTRADLPFVLAVRPSHGVWAPVEDPHTPPDAARLLPWAGVDLPGGWTAVERRFRDGHIETWWAADLELATYGPGGYFRMVVATTDPGTLPAASTWYLVTNLPHPTLALRASAIVPPADLAEVVRLYGLRQWVEQGYRQVKGALGWADFQVRADRAIRRHWQLVCCAFSFCWWAALRRTLPEHSTAAGHAAPAAEEPPVAGGKTRRPRGARGTPDALLAGGVARSASLAGPVDHALALLAGVVARAPAGCAAGPA